MINSKHHDYFSYLDAIARGAQRASVTEFAAMSEEGRDYPLVRIDLPGERMVVVTSGFHGEEPAGPLTLATHLSTLLDEARRLGIGLRVYPCINPSGFENGHRYNASGEKPNNDFLRYQDAAGVWFDTWTQAEAFASWKVFGGGPKETAALSRDLETLLSAQVPVAALDIHQDDFIGSALSYAYVFGAREPYLRLQKAASKHVEIARNCQVDETSRTDEDGLIVYHDGSVSDYFHRRGVVYVATLETTTITPLARCEQVNLIWLRGFMDLAARL